MRHIKVLFWNINKKATPFETIINDITKDTDILVLAEAENIDDDQIASAGRLERVSLVNPQLDQGKLTPKVYSNSRDFKLIHLTTTTSKRLIAYTLEATDHAPIIFFAIHFPSKYDYSNETQEDLASVYVSWVREIENLQKTKRTIICGDFNMNPFELGMIKPTGFNATMSKEIIREDNKRTFHYQTFDYFYNPMWAFMGDHSNGLPKLPGSYHYQTTTDAATTYWNVFDKVIVRPELIEKLDLASIKIEKSLDKHTFVDQKLKINKTVYSDHLPLTFNLLL